MLRTEGVTAFTIRLDVQSDHRAGVKAVTEGNAKHATSETTCLQLTKLLAKKCKLGKEAMHVLVVKFMEGQYACDFQDRIPCGMDPKVGQRQELLALANAESLNREELEHLIAFFKGVAPAVLQEVRRDLTKKLCIHGICSRPLHTCFVGELMSLLRVKGMLHSFL